MRAARVALAWLCLAAIAVAADTPEPFVGTWQLDSQQVDGQKRESDRLTLRISPDADKFAFAFAIPVNKIDFVSMTYSARLDGTEADVKNAQGVKVGTIQVTAQSRGHYKLLLKGPNRPDTTGQLIVSPDGQTLTSESEATQAGHVTHLVQLFSRH
jgi:hypothetical protein